MAAGGNGLPWPLCKRRIYIYHHRPRPLMARDGMFRNTPKAHTTIEDRQKIVTNKGVPAVYQSETGPPFQSAEIQQFTQSSGYHHHIITPEWSRANGTGERFNRSMKEVLHAANLEGYSLRYASQRFLLIYCSTPQGTTGVIPHAALHGGTDRNENCAAVMTPTDYVVDRTRDERYKSYMRYRLLPHQLRVGDDVIVRQTKTNKLGQTFNHTPLRITDVQGSRVTAREINVTRTVTRDGSYFRKITRNNHVDDGDQDASDVSDRDRT